MPEQLLEMCGSGQYRIEALDEYGKPLAEVAKIVVGIPNDGSTAKTAANQNMRTIASPTDSRLMLETIAQMSRAHSESLQSLANAQADWIKTLATAKQLPRNVNAAVTALETRVHELAGRTLRRVRGRARSAR